MMTTEPDSIVLDILRELQKNSHDLKLGQKQTNERLSALEHHMAGLVLGQTRFNDETDNLRARVERIERRLDLVDDPTDNNDR